MRTVHRSASLVSLLTLLACGTAQPEAEAPTAAPPPAAPPAASVAVAPAEEPPPTLRTGTGTLADLGTVTGEVLGRFDDAGLETIQVAFVPPAMEAPEGWAPPPVYEVVEDGGSPVLSFVERAWGDERNQPAARRNVWVRRPMSRGGPSKVVVLAISEGRSGRFVVEAAAPRGALDPARRVDFGVAVEDRMQSTLGASLFADTAARRVRQAYGKPPPATASAGRDRPAPLGLGAAPELGELMRATTGVSALRAALAHERPLALGAPDKPTVAIASVPGPQMPSHPWSKMSSAIGAKGVVEPLAAMTPADAWFVRARSLGSLFRLLDEADAWGTAAVRAAEDVAFDADVAERYETQLGLRRSALARAFGDGVVGEVAAVGSDPYVREGTDVSLLFRVKSRAPFEIALADALAERSRAHGALATSRVEHEGVKIAVARTAGGEVRQHRATVGDVEIVSNSLAAVKRIVDATKGKAPALSGEADIAYALARDAAEPADVLALVGERFVRRIVGPAHKIAEARRQVARARLLAPGAAAVLHGWLRGAPPASTDELVKSKLLDRRELTHDDGSPISFEPGRAPSSSAGTPAFLTPIVDLPAITKISPAERGAYDGFRRAYEGGWAGEPFDPIAVRVVLPEKGPLTAHVRVLPIPADPDIAKLMDVVGNARVRAEPAAGGARLVVGLSADERWRSELGLDLGRMIGGHRKVLDWIGQWVAVGVADHNGLLHASREDLAPEPPLPPDPERSRGADEIEALAKLPMWLGVEVRSPATLGILLTVLRKLADDAMPGLVAWGEVGKEGAVPIVGVTIDGEAIQRSARSASVSIFYAIAPAPAGGEAALYVSPRQEVLRDLLREHAAGRGPRTPSPGPSDAAAAQALVEVAARAGGPLATWLVWVSETSAREQDGSSRDYAEWFLRSGARPAELPALAQAYLGAVPTTPSGRAYELGPTGVTDPDRGSEAVPRWPALPIAGTPMAEVAARLARVRVETAFDDEPGGTAAAPLRSFRARITVLPR